MANETLRAAIFKSPAMLETASSLAFAPAVIRPGVSPLIPQPQPPAPAATPPPAPAPALPPPQPVVPGPPPDSPFANLPFPAPGDRIKADDFKALSQSLNILYNMFVVSSSLFGYTFGEAKAVLVSQRYTVTRVLTVFGNEITNLADASLDSRKVIQVMPVAPGDPRVQVVVTEAVDTRRLAPNLIGLTYRDAVSRIQSLLADVPVTGAPPAAPQLVGLTLTDTQRGLPK